VPGSLFCEPVVAFQRQPPGPSGRRFSGLGVAFAMILGIFNHQTLADETLTGEQLRTLISGNTLQGNFSAKRLTMVYYADGVVRGSMGLAGSDSGTWKIDGDSYCHEWVLYFSGDRRCYQWVAQSKGYLLKNVDKFKTRDIQGRLEEGKPKGY